MKLSILIPVYNEEKTIAELLDLVLATDVGAEKEVVVVDDASTDRTAEVLEAYRDRTLVLRHERNRGKGAALRTALRRATGDFVVPQDADLEYEPADLKKTPGRCAGARGCGSSTGRGGSTGRTSSTRRSPSTWAGCWSHGWRTSSSGCASRMSRPVTSW